MGAVKKPDMVQAGQEFVSCWQFQSSRSSKIKMSTCRMEGVAASEGTGMYVYFATFLHTVRGYSCLSVCTNGTGMAFSLNLNPTTLL
jgi:hypothetical protein